MATISWRFCDCTIPIQSRKQHISEKYRPAQDQCRNASAGNQWLDDHHLHKFGKTPEHMQHPTTQQKTHRSSHQHISQQKFITKFWSMMNTLTSFKLIKFWQTGLIHKSNRSSVVRLQWWQMVAVPLTGMSLACPCHTAILDAQFLHKQHMPLQNPAWFLPCTTTKYIIWSSREDATNCLSL
jgi:hypothetical protein